MQEAMTSSDLYNLNRFVEAQSGIYERVLEELRRGHKSTHWMWFIFPQIRGLGHTETSIFFAISSIAEAVAYLAHPILGPRLIECCELLLKIENKSACEIFGSPDDLKLRSSITLFAQVYTQNRLFGEVLDQYFEGKPDVRTLELLHLK